MSDLIKIKRSTLSGSVPTLQTGEPAVNLADHRLYLGGGAPGGYALGAHTPPWLKRTGALRYPYAIASASTGTSNIVADRFIAAPFVVPIPITLTGLGVYVTTSVSGTVNIGIYDTVFTGGEHVPGILLASANGIDVSTTGYKSGPASLTMYPGKVYWGSIMSSLAPVMRAVNFTAIYPFLGADSAAGSATNIYLYKDGVGATLPASAPTGLGVASATLCPAITLEY